MLDPVREKRDLHIRAAGIFVMQLKLLETQRFTALCHNEGPTLDEEPILATADSMEALEPPACGWVIHQFCAAAALGAAVEWGELLVRG